MHQDCSQLEKEMPVCDNKKVKSCPYARLVADAAVKKTLAILGVDIDSPESVEQFRISLRFGDRMRKAADKGFLVFVGLLVTGVCYAAAKGLKLL